MSLKLIAATGVDTKGRIIDVGGGTSKMPSILLDQGYNRITVLDISGHAINRAKQQLGGRADRITWIEADVTLFKFAEHFDIWHDRAVFHSLTDPNDRKRYVASLDHALEPGGHLVISTFGLGAPPKCSGLDVVRYSSETLHHEFRHHLELKETFDELHRTPRKVQQEYLYCHFTKRL